MERGQIGFGLVEICWEGTRNTLSVLSKKVSCMFEFVFNMYQVYCTRLLTREFFQVFEMCTGINIGRIKS